MAKINIMRFIRTGAILIVAAILSFFIIGSFNKQTNKIVELRKSKIDGSDSLVFNLGYPNSRLTNGYIILDSDTSEYFYFCNRSTVQKISIFTINGVLKYEIPLYAIGFYGDYIGDFYIHSLDTILVLTEHTNKLYFLNRTGQIWKKVDLNEQLSFIEQGIKYEVLSFHRRNFYYNGDVFFRVSLLKYPNPYTEYEDIIRNYNILSLKVPMFCKISNIFSDSVSLNFGFKDFKSKLYGNSYYPIDLINIYHINNRHLLTSIYSNHLYEFDYNSLELINIFTLKSNYSKLKIIPITFDEYLSDSKKNSFNNCLQSQGQIQWISYDYRNSKYYIIARHDRDSSQIINNIYPFSILLLDKTMNVSCESNIITKSYLCTPIIYNTKILIPNNSPLDDYYERNKYKYDVYTF